ncbi:hypothetical protein [Mesorhizobium sp.]|uniref:hypothetical protein n=1 Tax=Mesorhizobium sp. TaxID=1871066 RepID=UPI0011F71BD4|nr:hypothetical protein [Mesorhizobium sp.]TIO62926.1 MAG: hypothetical protein E5X79_01265 [Mesorhizobium sp.]
MARGLKVGDEVAITATVRRRVTEDRISLSIPTYGFPYSIRDCKAKVRKGQPWELTGDIVHVDEGRVTVNLGVPVTVDADRLRLITAYKPPVDIPD